MGWVEELYPLPLCKHHLHVVKLVYISQVIIVKKKKILESPRLETEERTWWIVYICGVHKVYVWTCFLEWIEFQKTGFIYIEQITLTTESPSCQVEHSRTLCSRNKNPQPLTENSFVLSTLTSYLEAHVYSRIFLYLFIWGGGGGGGDLPPFFSFWGEFLRKKKYFLNIFWKKNKPP